MGCISNSRLDLDDDQIDLRSRKESQMSHMREVTMKPCEVCEQLTNGTITAACGHTSAICSECFDDDNTRETFPTTDCAACQDKACDDFIDAHEEAATVRAEGERSELN